jgi:hypothetical protein
MTSVILLAGTVLTLVGGFYYFSQTADFEEQHLVKIVTEKKLWPEEKVVTEDKILAEYITSIKTEDRPLLIDDAVAYGIIAHLPNLNHLVMPLQKNFITVIENPALSVQYILIAKFNNLRHNFTAMNAYNMVQMKTRLNLKSNRVFETENWIVYSVR